MCHIVLKMQKSKKYKVSSIGVQFINYFRENFSYLKIIDRFLSEYLQMLKIIYVKNNSLVQINH